MFRGEVGLLRQYLNCIGAVGTEVALAGDGERIASKAVDPAHVMMGDFELKAKCEEFECNVDVDKFLSKLSGLKATDEVTVNYAGGGIVITCGRMRRSLPTIYSASDTPTKTPQLSDQWVAHAKGFDMPELATFLASAEKGYSYLRMSSKGGRIHFEATGDASQDSESLELCDAAGEDASSLYSTDLLALVCKAIRWATTTHLSFASDFPMSIGGTSPDGFIVANYVIAPRFEHD